MTPAPRLASFLRPESVALIGMPGDLDSPLARPLRVLERHAFAGAIYPINPRHATIGDLTCYPSLAALPATPDLAWIGLPGDRVLDVLDECIAAGVRRAVIVSAGFAERDARGSEAQRAIADRARRHGLTVLGPNSIGFANLPDRAPVTFSVAFDVPALVAGDVAIVTQSGGLGGAIFNRLQDRRLGVSYVISTGNEADVGLEECLEFLVADERTRVIVLVVEGIRDGARFRAAAARALEADKPLIALRLGMTELGGRMALSHTGAIAGSGKVWDGVARALGIVGVADIADIADAVIWARRASARGGRRVAVITSSGGAAVHLADRLSAAGFELPPIGDVTRDALTHVLPAYATPANPLDITAGLPEATFEAAARAMAQSGEFDALLVPLTMLSEVQSEARAATVRTIADGQRFPVALCWLGGSLAHAGISAADTADVPCFTSPSAMIRAMQGAVDRADARMRARARDGGTRGDVAATRPVALPTGAPDALDYRTSIDLLERFGIAQPAQALAPDVDGVIEASGRLAMPLAVKAVGRDFLHKSDRHALRLGLRTHEELARAAREIDAMSAGAGREGLLVQQMVEGVEVVVGVLRDPTFGHVVMLGPGGIGVELADDHRFLPLPVTAEDVRAALESIPSLRQLRGFRREPPRDVGALVHLVLSVGRLAEALGPGLREIDLNPVLVAADGKGAVAVDVLIVMDRAPAHG